MIEVSGLSKRFGSVVALDDVSFSASDGRITGLLGPNGAGKSTCLRILYTVLKPDAGSARINDVDVVAHPLWARRELGVLPHGAGLYPQLTTRENIAYFGRLHGITESALSERVDQLVARLELEEIADRRAKGFSQGQRTKVALARALVHRPKNLLLDEPTNGLDVMSTLSLRNWLSELKGRGQCIVLSNHIMQEVAALCDDIVIVAHGRIVAQGTTDALRERFGNKSRHGAAHHRR
jgi:sodium transport system ATP-binding protein